MDKEKAHALVASLIDAAYNTGYLSVVLQYGSPYYVEALKRRDELRDEIIRYLIDEEVGNG